MTEMMKALVAYAPHDYRYENFFARCNRAPGS